MICDKLCWKCHSINKNISDGEVYVNSMLLDVFLFLLQRRAGSTTVLCLYVCLSWVNLHRRHRHFAKLNRSQREAITVSTLLCKLNCYFSGFSIFGKIYNFYLKTIILGLSGPQSIHGLLLPCTDVSWWLIVSFTVTAPIFSQPWSLILQTDQWHSSLRWQI